MRRPLRRLRSRRRRRRRPHRRANGTWVAQMPFSLSPSDRRIDRRAALLGGEPSAAALESQQLSSFPPRSEVHPRDLEVGTQCVKGTISMSAQQQQPDDWNGLNSSFFNIFRDHSQIKWKFSFAGGTCNHQRGAFYSNPRGAGPGSARVRVCVLASRPYKGERERASEREQLIPPSKSHVVGAAHPAIPLPRATSHDFDFPPAPFSAETQSRNIEFVMKSPPARPMRREVKSTSRLSDCHALDKGQKGQKEVTRRRS